MNRYTDGVPQDVKFTIGNAYQYQSLVSLERALTPFYSQIKGLDSHVELAKVKCQYPSKHGLTHDESAAIYLYTMEWGEQSLYRKLNEALRSENADKFEQWSLFLKLFNSAINKLPTVKKCVWRGISNDISQNYRKGQILTWWSINSCSTSIHIIKGFLAQKVFSFTKLFSTKHSTLIMIEIQNGKDIKGYTQYPGEDEVVLPPGTKLRVVSDALHHDGGLHVIHLEEVIPSREQPIGTVKPELSLSPLGLLFLVFMFYCMFSYLYDL